MNNLAVLGLRAPARFPQVFAWAASIALLWFWWRYLVVWLDARSRLEFRKDFLQALRQTKWFQRHLLKNIDTDTVLKSADEAGYLTGGEMSIEQIFVDGDKRLIAKVEQISVADVSEESGSLYSVNSYQMMDGKPILVAIPWWMHYGIGIPFYWWRVIRHEYFANQIFPHILFVVALALIVLKVAGFDPAGLFGILSEEVR
ncbi:MAG TPA: hypothetical protein PKH39_13410 [Woeseiaceae bacterium]|nr:hypothetical protein [Woeseiaceae bacterium]